MSSTASFKPLSSILASPEPIVFETVSKQPARILRIVEKIRGDDQAHESSSLRSFGSMIGSMNNVEVSRRSVRDALCDRGDRPASGGGGGSDSQIPKLHLRMVTAAGPNPEEISDAELDQLLSHNRRARTSHSRGLDGDRFSFVSTGITKHPPLLGHEPRILEEILGNVPRPPGITRQQHALGEVPRLRPHVDGSHGFLPSIGAISFQPLALSSFCLC